MRMFAHIFKTWALAQILHPFIFMIYLGIMGSDEIDLWLAGIFFIFFFSVFASIPSLLVAWLLLYIISNAGLTIGEKFIAWFVSVAAGILLNFILLSFIYGELFDEGMYRIVPPSLIAAVLSIFIRLRPFFKFQSTYQQVAEKNI